jgi:hypothetical protein
MAGTIVTDRLESDSSYPSRVEVASPIHVSNTFSLKAGTGTGTVTIQPPNSNINRTLTLPNASATLLSSAGGSVAGQLSFPNGSNVRVSSASASWDILGVTAAVDGLEIRSGGNTQLRIDNQGRVTIPNQPAFYATHSSSSGPGGTAGHLVPGLNNPFIFPLVPVNIGGHYNTSNGRFTVPIAGRYWIQFSAGLFESNSQSGFDIRVNGSIFDGGEAVTTGGIEQIVSKSVLLNLNVGDFVTVTSRFNNLQLHQRYGNFCGYLIG